MDANMEMALQALETGDHHTARASLRELLQTDPDNELAWLWLAEVARSDEERDACLQQAQRISHLHDSGQRGAGLLGARAKARSAAEVEPEPAPVEFLLLPADVPVSHSVTLKRTGSPPGNVPVSHAVRVAAVRSPAGPAAATARATPRAAPSAHSSPPPSPGQPGWVQVVLGLGVVLLILVLIVVFVLVAVFVLESARAGLPPVAV